MRLGQLARRHDIPVQEIVDFLKEETGEKFHPNAKLYDAIETQIFKHFDLYPDDPVLEQKSEIEEPPAITELEEPVNIETPEDDIASVEGELETAESDEDPSKPEAEPTIEAPRHKEDEVIQTDRLIEMLESEEDTGDLERVKLIKAPKKELPGLKVLGKVDLPEPKKKPEGKTEKEVNQHRKKRSRPQLTEEEKEKRRLRAKRKKEAYEARQEKRRKEEEARELKELKAKHYEQKLKKTQTSRQNKKVKTQPEKPATQQKKIKQEPKTWLGKWWRWMNT